MLKLLRFLITGVLNKHEHKWEIEDKWRTSIYQNGDKKTMPCGSVDVYVQRCMFCGELKTFTVTSNKKLSD